MRKDNRDGGQAVSVGPPAIQGIAGLRLKEEPFPRSAAYGGLAAGDVGDDGQAAERGTRRIKKPILFWNLFWKRENEKTA